MPPRLAAALLCALACFIVAPTAAGAADYVSNFSLAPADASAGRHAQVDMHVDFGTDDPVRDLHIHLPPGLVGNPNAVPACSQADFANRACPADTRVGTTSALATATVLLVPVDATATGDVYNVVPNADEPARLGVVLSAFAGIGQVPPLPVQVGLRPDGGLDTTIRNIPATVSGLPTVIKSMDLHLGGTTAPTFMTNPTSCSVKTTTLEAVTRADVTHAAQSSFTPSNCGSVPFAPALAASIDARGPAGAVRRPALRTVITIPPGNAAASATTVTLPARLSLAPTAIKAVCTTAQQAQDACPPASRVGSVTAQTPLLRVPLSGPVYVAERPGELLPGLRLSLGGPVQLRLDGKLAFANGGLIAVFDGIPDVPLARLELTFSGGGPLQVKGDPCTGGLLRATGALTGHNGAQVTAPARVKLRSCPVFGRARIGKGPRPALRLDLRKGRDTRGLRSVRITLPRGLQPAKRGRLRASADGHRLGGGRAKLARRVLTVDLGGARTAVLRLDRGKLHGRPAGAFTIRATRTNGRTSTVRVKAKRLR